jgi:hypothetical protein
VLAQDAGDGVVTDGECELVLEALGAEAGLPAEPDDEAFQGGGGLMRAALGVAGEFAQGGRFAGDVAAALRPCLRAKAASFWCSQ